MAVQQWEGGRVAGIIVECKTIVHCLDLCLAKELVSPTACQKILTERC